MSARRPGVRRHAAGLLLAAPAAILLIVFILWPVVVSGQYSVTSASGYGDRDPVGLANFGRALADADLYAAFGRNVVFAAIVVTLSVAVGYLLAYCLHQRLRGWRVLQILFMVPYVMPVVVVALLWQFILEPENGLVNSGLRAIGLGALAGPGLTGQGTALVTVSLIQSWVVTPFAMLIILAAMIGTPRETMEAAELDGAGHWVKMTRVMLPAVRPSVVVAALVIAVTMFRSFDLVYLLTRGGPVGATTIATLYVYVTGFVNNEYGYANAVGIVLGVVLVALAVVPLILRRRAARHAALEDRA